MGCCPPGSSVHEILQARIQGWVALCFSRGSSWLRDQTHISCIAVRVYTVWATRECGLFFFFCPIPSSSPPPVPALFPTASENSPALDNSLGIPQGWNSHFQSSIQLIRRKLHRGGVNKKIIRNPFWSFFIEKQARLPPPSSEENRLTHNRLTHIFHLPRSYPFPSTCLDASKGICNIFSPKHNFFRKKKKFPPAIKWQLSTLSTELLGNCSSCQLG